jgi:hypothetical protein
LRKLQHAVRRYSFCICETFNRGPSAVRGRGGTWTSNGRRRGYLGDRFIRTRCC